MTEQQNYAGMGVWQPPPKKKLKKGALLWILLGLALLAVLLLLVFCFGQERANREAGFSSGAPYVGVLYVEGTMAVSSSTSSLLSGDGGSYDHQYLLNTVDEMMADPDNQGMLLYIDSPGGEVLAADELARKVDEYKESTGRPVYAYGHSYAASGGYWLACVADEIYLQRYCLTGSIGVTMGTLLDFSGLLEKYGVKAYDLGSGAQKNAGNGLTPTPQETIDIYQSIIDEYYGYFLDWVSSHRSNLGLEKLKTLADGRVYTARQAKTNGLSDHVGEYEDALDALLSQCDSVCQVRDFHPSVEQMGLMDMLWMQSRDNELSALLGQKNTAGPLVYFQFQ